MITIVNNDIMISRGDVINKYIYVPMYSYDADDKFKFVVSKLNDDGTKTIKLSTFMETITDEDGKCYLLLDVSSAQTKLLEEGAYIYDVQFIRGSMEFTLNYVNKFIVKGVAHNV